LICKKNLKIKPMKKILILFITITVSLSLEAQNSINLKLNPEKNRIYRFRSVSEQTVSQTVNGVSQATESRVSYTMSLKMLETTPDFIIAEVRFDTLVTITNTMGKVMTISSLNEGDIGSAETADILSCIMNRLSKNALYTKIDYSGKPVEIVNAAMIPAIVLRDTASISLKGAAAEAVRKQVIETVSEGNLKSMIAMFTHFLPARQVSRGEKWSINQQLNSGGMALDIISAYRLDDIDGTRADITTESAIKATENATPIESGGATVTYEDLKGMSRASMVVDVNTGLRIEENSKTHISGNLGISGPGFSMQMPMEINGETNIILLQ